jgi:putative transposase
VDGGLKKGGVLLVGIYFHQPGYTPKEYATMDHATTDIRLVPLPGSQDVLTDILRQGAQQLLAQAIAAEVTDWIDRRQYCRDDRGLRQIVRNGHLPERTLTTGVGAVTVKPPRVHDRRPEGEREKVSSAILPPYLRKTKSIEELIPWLYLKGVSTSDFSEALAAILGPDAKGLSATTVTRLKSVWQDEYAGWNQRSLAGKHYVYIWADGVYFNVRLEGSRQCILVLMGAAADGKKELIAIQTGQRESELTWKELLLNVQARGLTIDPDLAIGDGALGFWKALRQVYETTKEQRCWVHKTANVLDKLPQSVQPVSSRAIPSSPRRASRESPAGHCTGPRRCSASVRGASGLGMQECGFGGCWRALASHRLPNPGVWQPMGGSAASEAKNVRKPQ